MIDMLWFLPLCFVIGCAWGYLCVKFAEWTS
jgi:hypothetical protein